VVGGIVLTLAALAFAYWIAHRIEQGVVRNTALSTALYIESFLSTELQELGRTADLSDAARARLAVRFTDTALGERVRSYKIWAKGGRVVASSDTALVGQTFAPTESLAGAWGGEVRAEYQDLNDLEDEAEKALGVPLLEIYSPVRDVATGRIIAVAEFYEGVPQLEEELIAAWRSSYLVVFAGTLALGSALFGIVLRGSRTIDRQKLVLQRQLSDLTDLALGNTSLRKRIQQAAARSSALHEQILRRIGADLHDGPTQLLAFAALRLETLRGKGPGPATDAEFDAVDKAVKGAVDEIRSLSRGLTLPDIENRLPADVVRTATESHRARTGMEVALDCQGDLVTDLPDPMKICLYRFVQEGLTNVWRHGDRKDAEVRLRIGPALIELAVLDRGPGYDAQKVDAALKDRRRIGLAAMRDRVESLGGQFTFGNRDGGGGEVSMEIEY
jgi:signal transduction histidine kinase